ncbi:hypothetical protein AQJ91_27045 [Streptomyces dysideae]|uniref:Uncharacterized protein n=1 Tax=Streptomyces dysideae TaxID=909626 RepID=A0A101UWA9_9ACTN|nr:hypothetical protein AQJ91_27045 [Streptomyces dysideae]
MVRCWKPGFIARLSRSSVVDTAAAAIARPVASRPVRPPARVSRQVSAQVVRSSALIAGTPPPPRP